MAFIPCSSNIIEKEMISVIWNINGIYYNPTRLPEKYVQTIDGLYVKGIPASTNGTTVQCLLFSFLLQRDYYESNIATITITNNSDSCK